ncbi:hypothetical protein [Streptomyces sediminimaris]|uniref:hypothetical protein n=1 Tax=Streptomyces sediminimaris TaxID=3383721 RepID=UPI00399A4F90
MPIAQHDQPAYKLVCSNDDCVSDDTIALDEHGSIRLFESQAAARYWAQDNGWDISAATGVLCPADAAEARERRDQAEEIAAALGEGWGAP